MSLPEIRFYHLTRTPLEAALPDLLGRSLERGWRAVVMTGSETRTAHLSSVLWTRDPSSFLPHGQAEDGRASAQPIWLTHLDENPNGAQVCFLTDGAETENSGFFETVCVLFDGDDPDAVAAARSQWSAYKEKAHPLAYWAQDPRGAWSKKTES